MFVHCWSIVSVTTHLQFTILSERSSRLTNMVNFVGFFQKVGKLQNLLEIGNLV